MKSRLYCCPSLSLKYTIQISIKLKEIIQGEKTRNEASSLQTETENANQLLSGSGGLKCRGRVTVCQISISRASYIPVLEEINSNNWSLTELFSFPSTDSFPPFPPPPYVLILKFGGFVKSSKWHFYRCVTTWILPKSTENKIVECSVKGAGTGQFPQSSFDGHLSPSRTQAGSPLSMYFFFVHCMWKRGVESQKITRVPWQSQEHTGGSGIRRESMKPWNWNRCVKRYAKNSPSLYDKDYRD